MDFTLHRQKATLDTFNPRLLIVNYFDELQNQIDVDAETLLIKLYEQEEKFQTEIDGINKAREELVTEIKRIEKANLEYLNKNRKNFEMKLDEIRMNSPNKAELTAHDLNYLIQIVFSKHCIYVQKEHLSNYIFDKYKMGILLVTDWFIPEKTIESLNYFLSTETKLFRRPNSNIDNDLDKVLNKIVVNNLFIEHQVKSALENNLPILELGRSRFENIKEIIVTDSRVRSIERGLFDGFSQLKHLNLSSNKLTDINAWEFTGLTNLEELILDKNLILSIDRDSFPNLPNLKSLSLADNKIGSLDNGALDCLINLEHLNLSTNGITHIATNTFMRLSKLKELKLVSNKFQSLNFGIFNGLESLEILDLNENLQLETIDNNVFFQLKKLKVLQFKNNKIKELDSLKLEGLTYLEELYLQSLIRDFSWLNRLRHLRILSIKVDEGMVRDLDLSELSRLEQLELSCSNFLNPTLELDLDIFPVNLKTLRILKLSGIKILRDCPYLFDGLKNLEELYFNRVLLKNDNNLYTIFNSLKQLKKLDFSRHFSTENIISKKSMRICLDIFQNMPSLGQLNVVGIPQRFIITPLPNGFQDYKLNQIERLNLSHINLEILDMNTLYGLDNLKHLDLSNNKLRKIEQFPACLVNLIELDLRQNNLEDLSDNLFLNLSKLKCLDLSNNLLKQLGSSSFVNMNTLEFLNLSSNSMERIDKNFFKHMTNLKDLDLSNNKLTSVESLRELKMLRRISLRFNGISSMNDLFERLINLERVDLDGNSFKTIDLVQLARLKKISYIDLGHNQLEILDIDVLNYLLNKENLVLEIYENPICNNYVLHTKTKKNSIK